MRALTAFAAFAALFASAGSACSGASSSPAVVASPRSQTPSVPHTQSASSSTSPACAWRVSTRYRHVIWIWMENRPYSSVVTPGSQVATYAARCGLATRYVAVAHPSLPNYLAATSGSTGGVRSDCDPAACPQRRASLMEQVQSAGRQWRGYAETMPASCDPTSSGRYAARHNPPVYYPHIRSRCHTWDVAMGGSRGAFATALAQRSLPAFSFVTPNLCDDGHDCATATADRWLGTWLNRITNSAAYRAGDTAVFVTWDEGEGSSQRVATIVVAPTVHRGSRSSTRFTHYSLLRTTEELLGLKLLGAAASAHSMRAAFNL